MHKLPCIGLIGLMLAVSCQSRQTSQSDSATSPDSAATTTTLSTQCYAFASDKDTIGLILNQISPHVRGNLLYKLAGKDQNAGTIEGDMRGDTLLATYTFQSEGTQSVREIVFLKQGNGLVEGYGPVQQQQSGQTFTDRSKLTFDTTRRLQPIPCP